MQSFDHLFSSLVQQGSSIVFERLEIQMKAYIIAELFRHSGKDLLVLTGEGQEESQLVQNLEFFSLPIVEIPSWETLPTEGVAPSSDIVGARQKAFADIADRKTPLVILSSLQSCLQRVLPLNVLEQKRLVLTTGEEVPFDVLTDHLKIMGYERRSIVVEKGEFAIRGGIIDIFPVTQKQPVRIEFFGDEIESIRFFDPGSQRSADKLEHISLSPAKELEELHSSDDLTTLFDLRESIVVLDDLEKLEDRYASLISLGAVRSKIFMGVQEWLKIIHNKQLVMLSFEPLESLSKVHRLKGNQGYAHDRAEEVRFSLFEQEFAVNRINHPLRTLPEFYEEHCLLKAQPVREELFDGFLQLQETHSHTLIVQSLVELEWCKTKVRERGGEILPLTQVKEGYLSAGIARSDSHEILFATAEITGRTTVRRDAQRMTSLVTDYDAFEIEPGDYVVHFHHGFGRYCGIEERPDAQGEIQEFFVIEYAERSRLFVPLHQAHLISKYVGGKEEAPKLHVLGTNRWKKLREDTERAILGYASDLLKREAQRVIQGGFVCAPDGLSMQLFEAEFPYTETQDQLKAIADIKQDMCSEKAMDRLVCGDVGYGKTEVAMRAAFKAVIDGKKQVALLAPTTVLAVQHYENFTERMSPFGVTIGILSRFSTNRQNLETIERAKNGEIDILIGTHRLVQKDVGFKDLGLLIIDEEQRFGVKAKEQLKIIKENVDCLTLSATPIPRTLYMSLINVRDLSTISTPPHDRLPTKSVVCESDEKIMQTAMLRELNRGGQVFYVHNHVDTIFKAADGIKKLVPRARVAVAHGQMSGDEIDCVFHAFRRGEIDVLVATSIIENGIDIPNANTIIVDRADRFGLADLYQLRGRVGRWNRRAYAYFLLPTRRVLSEIARKRIEAIAQAGGYGGGLRVAMRDLEIRGAGDILGTEQSGQVAAIGFHLYCKLLKRTIDSLKGETPSWTIDTKLETPYIAKLPETYVNEISLRIEFYQRLGDAKSSDEVKEIEKEIADRFGPLPKPASWLISCTRVRIAAAQKGYSSVQLTKYTLSLEKKHGKKMEEKKIVMSLPKTPEEFEEKVTEAL